MVNTKLPPRTGGFNTHYLAFLVLVLLLAGIIVADWQFGLDNYFSKETIQERVDRFGMWAPLLFVGFYILATVLFVPGTPLALAAGALFGAWYGTLWGVLGATIGASIAFIVSSFLGRSFISSFLSKRYQRVQEYNEKLKDHAFSVILFLRLVPLFPFNGLNFALGLTKTRFWDYVAATALGIIPGSFVFAYLGSSLVSLSIGKVAGAVLLLLTFIIMTRKASKLSKTYKDNEYDIIVIGAGSGGLNVASFMNNAGFRVLLIDKDDASIGGDCLNFGCVPSKALIHTARQIQAARASKAYGLRVDGKPDITVITSSIKEKQAVIRTHENAQYFRNQGIDVVLGKAVFSGKQHVSVSGTSYSAKRIVLATGSRPRELSIPGIEIAPVYTNETVFDIDHLPERFVFIGGGPISIELAQSFQRLGSSVTVIERGNEILGKEDPEIARIVRKKLEEEGVEFLFGYDSKEVAGGSRLLVETKEGEQKEVPFDALFVGIGRILNIEELNVGAAGIKTDESSRKLIVDDYLRTTNKRVFTIGDVAGSLMFTHAAELHASLVIQNFFRPIFLKKKLSNDAMSWVTFTSPEVATFGLQEHQLKERGVGYQVLEKTFEDDDRAIVDEYRCGKLKLFIDNSERILGGTMVAEHAGELVQELILAVTHKMKAGKLFEKIYPYPTAARVNKSVIAQHMSSKLTFVVKKMLKMLY